MEFTGERVIPGQVDADLWNEHLARYEFAAWLSQRLQPRRVLDAGCGSGYGSAQLARLGKAAGVTGVDISEEALSYARSNYAAPNLAFTRGDCLALEFKDGEFDLVVAFEVIEHMKDAAAFLAGVSRVLAPSGCLIVSTPNRRYYTEERRFTNPFHTKEYDAAEFDELLKPFFPERRIFLQNHAAAISFHPCGPGGTSEEAAGRFAKAPEASDQAHFLVAVCSRQPIPALAPFVFVPSAANVLREREQHIAKLEQDLAQFQQDTRRELEERKRWAEKLEAEIASRDEAIRKLQAELGRANEWAKQLDAHLEEARGVIAERDKELEARTTWAQQLEKEGQRLSDIIKELQADLESKVTWARSLEANLTRARDALAKLQTEFDERTAWALSLQAEVEKLKADLSLIFASRWFRLGKKLGLGPALASGPDRKANP